MNALMEAVEAYDLCAPGYRGWRWSMLWDEVEVPVVLSCLPATGSVLDLGCGYGRYATPCTTRGLRYEGVDASEAMLRLASERRAVFACADLYGYRTPVPADAVLCTRVLSNLAHPRVALTAVSGNLAPSGTFVLTDFHERHRFDRQTIETPGGRNVPIPVFRHSAATIRRTIRYAGLNLQEERVIYSEGGKPVLVMYRGTKPPR